MAKQDEVAAAVAREPGGVLGPDDDAAAGSRHAPQLGQPALAATHPLDLYCSDQVRFDTWGGLYEFAVRHGSEHAPAVMSQLD